MLLEKPARYAGQLVGRSPYLQPTHVWAPASRIGEIVTVTATHLDRYSLFGELPGESAPLDFVRSETLIPLAAGA